MVVAVVDMSALLTYSKRRPNLNMFSLNLNLLLHTHKPLLLIIPNPTSPFILVTSVSGQLQASMTEERARLIQNIDVEAPPVQTRVLHLPQQARVSYGALRQDDVCKLGGEGSTSTASSINGGDGSGSLTPTSAQVTPTGALSNKKKRKYVASWFTPSFVVIALVVMVGDTARGCLFPTLWPLVSSLGGDRIMQGYVVSAFSLGR